MSNEKDEIMTFKITNDEGRDFNAGYTDCDVYST